MTCFDVPDREEIRQMNKCELDAFCKDVRNFLIDRVSKKGGHLASNLGTVELTVALWRIFDFPRDKVVFDVGHQSYTYKLLSGRKAGFDTLREFGGMSGFPKTTESEYDAFDTGHSSTGISAGLGLVYARDLKKADYKVISVIGDGAMTGGEAFEALNNATALKSNFIIILNDNKMSISDNVGGISSYLTGIRSSKGYNKAKDNLKNALNGSSYGQKVIKSIENTKDSLKEIVMPNGMVFENLGIKYLGPVDGHDILKMEKIFRRAKEMNRPVLIHVLTKKGKGYTFAEQKPSDYHGVGAFDTSRGVTENPNRKPCYAHVLSEFLEDVAECHKEVVTVTAAMGENVGFGAFKKAHPARCFDVGIAEQHAVTFSAGLSAGGLHPYFAVYSSFLQRGFDQIITDVALQNLRVTFLIDRAGLVGRDGETHQGAFDLSYLSSVPNMTVLAPSTGREYREMLNWSLDFKTPLAIRYPRGASYEDGREPLPMQFRKSELLEPFTSEIKPRVTLLSVGEMLSVSRCAAEKLREKGIDVCLVNVRFVKPFDEEAVKRAFTESDLTVTLEDGLKYGGFGSAVSQKLVEWGNSFRTRSVLSIGIPDAFIPQGSVHELFKLCGMDEDSVVSAVLSALGK